MSIASCFVNKGRKILSFELGEEMEKDVFFFFVPARDKTKKKIFLYFFTELKTNNLSYSIYKNS